MLFSFIDCDMLLRGCNSALTPVPETPIELSVKLVSRERVEGSVCKDSVAGNVGLEVPAVLTLDRASCVDASDGAYSAIEAAVSEPSEVIDGFPESLRTRNCETDVFTGEGRFEDSGEVGRPPPFIGSANCVGDRSENVRVSGRLSSR